MKKLREIARVISEGGYEPEILGGRTGWTPQLKEFYDTVTDRTQIRGDTSFDNQGRIRKHRLRRRLLNSLFLLQLPSPEFSSSTRAFYSCNKQLFFVKTLIRFGARGVAMDLARKILPLAERFQITNVELELVMALRAQGHLSGSYRDFEHYDRLVDKLLLAQSVENQAVRSYEWATIGFVKRLMAPEQTVSLTLEFAEALRQSTCFERFRIRLIYYRLMVIHLEISGQFERMIELCKEAILFLDQNGDHTFPALHAEFYMQQVVASLFTQQYDYGRVAIENARNYFRTGSNNWFEFMQFVFLHSMHESNYQQALRLWEEVSSHDRYATLDDHVREKWRIFAMYLEFLSGRKPSGVSEYMPHYSSDKHGYNVALIVIHILKLIESEKLGAITEQIDALKSYKARYLRPSINPRASLFLKMILLLEKESFSLKNIRKRGAPLLEQLLVAKPSHAEITEGLQVVPYETLWREMLDRLDVATKRIRLREVEENSKAALLMTGKPKVAQNARKKTARKSRNSS